MKIDQLTNEVLQLDCKERATLAEKIWESLEEPYIVFSDNSDKESLDLAKQRDDEIANGDVKSLSHKVLMARLRRNED